MFTRIRWQQESETIVVQKLKKAAQTATLQTSNVLTYTNLGPLV